MWSIPNRVVIRHQREEAGWTEKKYMRGIGGSQTKGISSPIPRGGGGHTKNLAGKGVDPPPPPTTHMHASSSYSSLLRCPNRCHNPSPSLSSSSSDWQWRLRHLLCRTGCSSSWDIHATVAEEEEMSIRHPPSPQR